MGCLYIFVFSNITSYRFYFRWFSNDFPNSQFYQCSGENAFVQLFPSVIQFLGTQDMALSRCIDTLVTWEWLLTLLCVVKCVGGWWWSCYWWWWLAKSNMWSSASASKLSSVMQSRPPSLPWDIIIIVIITVITCIIITLLHPLLLSIIIICRVTITSQSPPCHRHPNSGQ